MKSIILWLVCSTAIWPLEVTQSVAPMQIVSSEPINWKVQAYGKDGPIQLELSDFPKEIEILSRREKEETVGQEYLKVLEGVLTSKVPGGYWLPSVIARDASGIQTSAPAFVRIVSHESARISLTLIDSRLPEWQEDPEDGDQNLLALLLAGVIATMALGFYLARPSQKQEVFAGREVFQSYLRNPVEPDEAVFEALYEYMEARGCPKARLDLLVLPDFSSDRLASLQARLEHFRYGGGVFPLLEFSALIKAVIEEGMA